MGNIAWAKFIICQVVAQGIHYFCIAPGRRSTPLAVALGEEKNASYTTHFDERGLGFYALGHAKASGEPVAIIVTSGTAVGNLMPAVMEAWHSEVPLLLLTADRPPELRECGANQTTDQVKLFSSFVHFEVDFPCPFPKGERYLASAIGYGIHIARRQRGPVHFNCMFREPFIDDDDDVVRIPPILHYHETPKSSVTMLEAMAAELISHEKGIIICGQNTKKNSPRSSIHALAEHLQWPLLADVGSNLRGVSSPAAIDYYDFLLKQPQGLQPTAILHFGGRLVSRPLLEWCKRLGSKLYMHIDDSLNQFNPEQIVTHRFYTDAETTCSMLLALIEKRSSSSWLGQWQELASPIYETLQTLLSSSCSEPGLMHALQTHATRQQAFFFANSMPIRDANLFFFPAQDIGPIFTNRGLSGIDGNIATVAGIAKALQKPVIAVLGDLTALHDLNSLALLKKIEVPILLIVINNAGGAVFSFMPDLRETSHFEELFSHHHNWEFGQAAALFSLHYHLPSSMSDLEAIIREFCFNPSTSLLELSTSRTANLELHREIESQVLQGIANVCASVPEK